MGVTRDVGTTEVRVARLLRSLFIRCPATGERADTGFELTALPSIRASTQVLVDCLECGQDHEWRVEAASFG